MFHERRFQLPYTDVDANSRTQVSISDTGSHIAVKIEDHALAILSLNGDEVIMKHVPPKQKNHVGRDTFALSHDGQLLATYDRADRDYKRPDKIRLWKTSNGKLFRDFKWQIVFPTYHAQRADITHFQFFDESKQLAAFTQNGEVAIWSTMTGNLLRLLGQDALWTDGIILSTDGQWIVSSEHNIELVDHPSLAPVGRYYQDGLSIYGYRSQTCYKLERAGSPFISRWSNVPVGTMYVGDVDRFVFKIWDTFSGAPIRDMQLPFTEAEGVALFRKYGWKAYIIRDLRLDGENTKFAGESDGKIFIWDIVTGDIIQMISHDTKLRLLGFNADDRYLICYDKQNLYLWDIENQAWDDTYQLKGQIGTITMSENNRISATYWHKKHWSVSIIDLVI